MDNRDNKSVYSVATNGFLGGSTFRIKRTKVPLLLEVICHSGKTGQKSSVLKCLRKLWA